MALQLPHSMSSAPEVAGGAVGTSLFPELVFGVGVLAGYVYLSVKYPDESSTCAVPFPQGSTEWQRNMMSCGYLATVLAPSPTPNKVQLKRYDPNGGHHVFAKAAWLQSASSNVYMMGYDEGAALAISAVDLIAQEWRHSRMTGKQSSSFAELKKDVQNKIRENTLEEHARIAFDAMVAGGVPSDDATRFVIEAETQLRSWGITAPYRIPWDVFENS